MLAEILVSLVYSSDKSGSVERGTCIYVCIHIEREEMLAEILVSLVYSSDKSGSVERGTCIYVYMYIYRERGDACRDSR